MLKPVLLQLGPVAIRWYGLFLAAGAIAGFFYAQWIEKRLGGKIVKELFLPLVLFGLLGARLYHVVNELPFYLAHPAMIPAIWHGGLAIHGSIIADALYLWHYSSRKRVSFLRLADILMPSLLLGQAIGRWGNFFNQELFGRPTSLPWGIFIEPANRPETFGAFTHFHPTFLYESLWNLFIAALIALWIKKRPTKKSGIVFAFSLIGSGIGRIFTELLRIDAVPIVSGIRLPLIISAVIFCGGVMMLGIIMRAKQ